MSLFGYDFVKFLLSLGIGVSYGFVTESVSFVYISILMQVCVALIWLHSKPWFASLVGIAFGLGFISYSTTWLWEAMEYFGVDLWVAYLFCAGTIVLLSLPHAVGAYLVSRLAFLSRGKGVAIFLFLILFAMTWLLTEWLRSWVFTGFPFFQLGYAYIDTTLSGYIPVFGSLGVSFFVSLIAGLIIWLLLNWRVVSGWGKLTVVIAVVGVIAIGGLLGKVEYTTEKGMINVRVINGGLDKVDKQKNHKVNAAIDQYLAMTKSHPQRELVIWPESSVPSNFHKLYEDRLKSEFKQLSEQGVEVLLGTYINHLEDDVKKYNVMLLGSDADQWYAKRHLVPFGEYMPAMFQYFFPSGFLEDLSVGRVNNELAIHDYVVASNICFEMAFSHLVNSSQSELLVNVSDSSWFAANTLPERMIKVARARALEAGKYLIRSDNDGLSVVLSHQGDVVRLASDNPAFIDAEIGLRHGETPYGRWRHISLIVLIFSLFSVYSLLVASRKFILNKFYL